MNHNLNYAKGFLAEAFRAFCGDKSMLFALI
jgi:hypothetical protein